MRLSFVIPAYNEEAYIGKCLESILHELRGNLDDAEIIVVNNASTDRTKTTTMKYPNVKVVDESRKGIVWARQAGYLAAAGDLIANIDADTVLPPGWIDRVFHEFQTNRDLVCLSGPQVFPDLPWHTRAIIWSYWNLIVIPFYLLIRFVFRAGSVVQGGNFVVRRDALAAVGGYNTNLEFWGEDADVGMRLRKVGDVNFVLWLPIHASGRRLTTEGLLRTGLRYILNAIWIIFFRRPFPLTRAPMDVR